MAIPSWRLLLPSLPTLPHTDTVVNSLARPKASSTKLNCLNVATQILRMVRRVRRRVMMQKQMQKQIMYAAEGER